MSLVTHDPKFLNYRRWSSHPLRPPTRGDGRICQTKPVFTVTISLTGCFGLSPPLFAFLTDVASSGLILKIKSSDRKSCIVML